MLISAKSEARMLEVKSALIWILAVLQPLPKDREGMLYLQLDLDFPENGIPETIEFKPQGTRSLVPQATYKAVHLYMRSGNYTSQLRVGQVVEFLFATFPSPLPLLLLHSFDPKFHSS
jgi:hypothetical protein